MGDKGLRRPRKACAPARYQTATAQRPLDEENIAKQKELGLRKWVAIYFQEDFTYDIVDWEKKWKIFTEFSATKVKAKYEGEIFEGKIMCSKGTKGECEDYVDANTSFEGSPIKGRRPKAEAETPSKKLPPHRLTYRIQDEEITQLKPDKSDDGGEEVTHPGKPPPTHPVPYFLPLATPDPSVLKKEAKDGVSMTRFGAADASFVPKLELLSSSKMKKLNERLIRDVPSTPEAKGHQGARQAGSNETSEENSIKQSRLALTLLIYLNLKNS